MPRIIVQMHPRDLQAKRQLAERITEVVVDVCKVAPELVTMVIDEMPAENYAKAGVLRCDWKK